MIQTRHLPLTILGLAFTAAGLLLSLLPQLVQTIDPSLDLFDTIEVRVKWGALLGAGLLLMAHQQLQPWKLTLAAIAFWLTLGILVARISGLMIEGMESPRQWFWTGFEGIILIAAGYLMRRLQPQDQ